MKYNKRDESDIDVFFQDYLEIIFNRQVIKIINYSKRELASPLLNLFLPNLL